MQAAELTCVSQRNHTLVRVNIGRIHSPPRGGWQDGDAAFCQSSLMNLLLLLLPRRKLDMWTACSYAIGCSHSYRRSNRCSCSTRMRTASVSAVFVNCDNCDQFRKPVLQLMPNAIRLQSPVLLQTLFYKLFPPRSLRGFRYEAIIGLKWTATET